MHLKRRVTTYTKALKAKVNKHEAVNKAHNDGLATLATHETESHTRFAGERADLERQLAKMDTDLQAFDTDISTQRAALYAVFESDTLDYKRMNASLLKYEGKRNQQDTLLKTKNVMPISSMMTQI